MPEEWWEGTFEERMARRLARRAAQGFELSTEQHFDIWDRHGAKLVTLKLRVARKPFNYEAWLHRKAGEQMGEDRIAKSRLREIWNAVIIDEMNLRAYAQKPYHLRIKAAPRIRGLRAAAKRAGFSE